MFATVSVQLPTATLRRLALHLDNNGGQQELGELVVQAIDAWLAADDAPAPPVRHGYQWKSLFLPEGTQLRMMYRQEYVYASVVGDVILYQQRAVSPRQFVMGVSGTVRNAWKELWICCPGDVRWHLAHTRRTILRRVLPAPVASNAARASDPGPTPPGERRTGIRGQDSWTRRYLFAWRHRRFLHRDDIVRDDQPDLSKAGARPPSPGKSYVPGRSGPRERRAGGYPWPATPSVQPAASPAPPSTQLAASPSAQPAVSPAPPPAPPPAQLAASPAPPPPTASVPPAAAPASAVPAARWRTLWARLRPPSRS